jgi:hypothetical protein
MLLLGGGVIVVRGLENSLHAVFDKPPAPLQQPLALMRRQLGTPVRYDAGKPDEVLDPATVETLGTSDYLMRTYRDLTLDESDQGAFIHLNLNYYPNGSSTPHVPEVCWAGSGREEAPGSRETFEVSDVPRRDGSKVNLRVKLISFYPTAEDGAQAAAPALPGGEQVYTNVAYVFQVNGDYVANPQEVTSRFWKASFRYAYHAKIEVTPLIRIGDVSGGHERPLVCTRTRARQIVSDFLRNALAGIEECLPDPAILTAPDAGSVDRKPR